MFTGINKGLIGGRGIFMDIAPGIPLKGKWIRRVMHAFNIVQPIVKCIQGQDAARILGNKIGRKLTNRVITNRFGTMVTKCHNVARIRTIKPTIGLSASNRNWICNGVDNSLFDKRIVKRMRVMYHHANRAGKHLDIHIGHLSLVMKVTGKPVEELIKFNSNGILTETSKNALINHIKGEISNNARVAQNHDHTVSNAKCSWYQGQGSESGYGSGPTRQTVIEQDIEVYKASNKDGGTLHLYIPAFNKHRGVYLHRLYNPPKGTPICIIGNEKPKVPTFKERLHLKMVQPEAFGDFLKNTDQRTTTRKYDGASTYITIGSHDEWTGARLWSPRTSKETGKRIEYTFKVPELATLAHDKTKVDQWIGRLYPRVRSATGMGELLFWKRTIIGNIIQGLIGSRGPEGICWNYTSAAETGGTLNAASIRRRDLLPELRMYRVDMFNSKDIYDLSFFDNRVYQQAIALLSPNINTVALTHPRERKDWEGLVAVPHDLSVNDGLKLKWWADAHDWEVIDVQLGTSSKGFINGVVQFRSLESGREFKLGPGSLGGTEQCLELLHVPDDYIGRVAKVISRNSFEGRSSKLVSWHLDK